MDVSLKERYKLSFDFVKRLTIEVTPAGDVARFVVWKDEVGGRETGSPDGVREGDGRLQLDQGNVVPAEEP